MQAEFPIDPVICDCVRPEGFCHTSVWVRLSDWTEKPVFLHQSADLFQVHPDSLMEKTHVDTACAFGITAVMIGGLDQFKIRLILLFMDNSGIRAPDPVIVSRT